MDKITPGTAAPIDVVPEETLHFDYPGSDILLRSCDSHDFRVPQLYLANSSPLLGELIQRVLNTPDVVNREEKEPLPVVELCETGSILYSLLTFIFPVAPVLPSTMDNIMKLLAVAQKYRMDSVLTLIRAVVFQKKPQFLLPENALRLYFLAQKHELQEEALVAARITLSLPMTIEDLGDKIDFMPGAYLHGLWKYHESFKVILASSLKYGVPAIVEAEDLRCRAPPPNTSSPILQWIDGYIESLAQTPHLFDPIEFEDAWARHIKDSYSTCSCVDISNQTRHAFWDALIDVFNEAMEKVCGSAMTRRHRGDRYEPHAGRFDSSGSREGRTNFRRPGSSTRTIMFEPTRCKYYTSIVGPGQFPCPQVIACPLVSIFQKRALNPTSSHRPSSPID